MLVAPLKRVDNYGISMGKSDVGLNLTKQITSGKISQDKPIQISLYDKLILVAVGFVSSVAFAYALSKDIQTPRARHQENTTSTKTIPLEELLSDFNVLGRLEIKFKDLRQVSKNGYLVGNKNGHVFYEFSEDQRCIYVYPLAKKQSNKDSSNNSNNPESFAYNPLE